MAWTFMGIRLFLKEKIALTMAWTAKSVTVPSESAMFLHAYNKDPDQIARMRRLTEGLVRHTYQKVRFLTLRLISPSEKIGTTIDSRFLDFAYLE